MSDYVANATAEADAYAKKRKQQAQTVIDQVNAEAAAKQQAAQAATNADIREEQQTALDVLDSTAVQRQLEMQQVRESMANWGLTGSGSERARITGAQTAADRRSTAARRTRDTAIAALTAALAATEQEIERQRLAEETTVRQTAEQDVADNRESLLKSAYTAAAKEEAARIKAEQAAEEAERDRQLQILKMKREDAEKIEKAKAAEEAAAKKAAEQAAANEAKIEAARIKAEQEAEEAERDRQLQIIKMKREDAEKIEKAKAAEEAAAKKAAEQAAKEKAKEEAAKKAEEESKKETSSSTSNKTSTKLLEEQEKTKRQAAKDAEKNRRAALDAMLESKKLTAEIYGLAVDNGWSAAEALERQDLQKGYDRIIHYTGNVYEQHGFETAMTFVAKYDLPEDQIKRMCSVLKLDRNRVDKWITGYRNFVQTSDIATKLDKEW